MDREPELLAPDLGYALVRDRTAQGSVAYAFGELDLSTASAFESFLLDTAAGPWPVVAELSECRFIDASIVSVLIRVRDGLGDAFRIVAPRTSCARRLLGILDLIEPLGVHETQRSAFAGGRPQTNVVDLQFRPHAGRDRRRANRSLSPLGRDRRAWNRA